MEIERQTVCGLRLSLRVAVLTESKRFYLTECLPPTAPPPVFSGVYFCARFDLSSSYA